MSRFGNDRPADQQPWHATFGASRGGKGPKHDAHEERQKHLEHLEDTCTISELVGSRAGPLSGPCGGVSLSQRWIPRGVRVRSSITGRAVRRMMANMPQGLAIIILSLHMIVLPVSITGVQLIQPTAVQRIADRESMQDNENTLQAIWALVESMHYGRTPDSHLNWIETLETTEGSVIRRALKRWAIGFSC